MKLNDTNTAIYFLLDKRSSRFRVRGFCWGRGGRPFMKEKFPSMKPAFRKRIQYVCGSFYEAFFKGKGRLLKLLLEEPVEQSGTFIISKKYGWIETIFYDIKAKYNGVEWIMEGWEVGFISGPPGPRLISYMHFGYDGNTTFWGIDVEPSYFNPQSRISEILGLILFQKFCEVETKMIPPGGKVMHLNEEYVNETKLPVEIMDSSWLTSVVGSEEFNMEHDMGGFFTWQPAGADQPKEKLIWIPLLAKKRTNFPKRKR